ncbi:hypothetical protein K504DRAFT_260547 [Pleomassaria siparia CBS 279.74]|uniref:Uncharacterized protein n=1 Tax=Pleomassaria siparia CBS 279.74 TaxID=1314801 RepID=A0A6G1KCW8_9PLEO|nr:hypothetical protein K504DRAFT_260547 [Pleomassaria siparia CBS 279.74]
MLHEDATMGINTHPVFPTDTSILEYWPTLSMRVVESLQELEKRHQFRWNTIDLLRRGYSIDAQQCPITIVVGSPDADSEQLRTQVVRDLKALADVPVEVEVVYSEGFQCLGNAQVDMLAHDNALNMGASISGKDEPQGGTLGGKIQLQTTGGADSHMRLQTIMSQRVII